MNVFNASELGSWSGGVWSPRQPFAPITGFANDSRRVRAGDCFVALSTQKRDGHDFVEQAWRAGASGAIVARAVPQAKVAQLIVSDPLEALQQIASGHRQRFLKPVAAVTGSAGKTSTKDLLKCLLGGGDVCATQGNYNNFIGVPLTLLEIEPQRHRYAVVEAGSNHPGEIERLGWLIDLTVSLVTLVGPAHLEFFGDLEGVAAEKVSLIRQTRPGGAAFVAGQCFAHRAFEGPFDCAVMAVVDEDAALPTRPKGAQMCLYRAKCAGARTQLWLRNPSGSQTAFEFDGASKGMAANAALALFAARYLGRSDADLAEALGQWKPSALRGQLRRLGGKLYYIDCYNSNPASLVDAFATFQALADEALPRLYVIGAMGELGEDAPALHRRAAATLRLRREDRAVAVGAYADCLAEGLVQGGASASQVETAPCAQAAASLVEAFEGALFFKGSRSVGLEKLLPAELLEPSLR